MKLGEFAILTDENLHPAVVAELRAMGCDVFDVRENDLLGEDDIALLALANSQERVIVTHDNDFGMLAVARREPIVGIVYLRPGHIDPQFTIDTLRLLFAQNIELTPPFVVVAKRTGNVVKIRVRHL